ncbi:MAG: hypothetical protein HOQ02_12015 [Lysobacter sp.]|nr:hypothetical protein [Lysobacter sp.]
MGRTDNGARPANSAQGRRWHVVEQGHGTEVLALDRAPAVEVGPGCTRRALPAPAGLRAWVVEMAPGSRWPHVDDHPHGELYVVLEGEVIEGDARHGAGSYVHFAPGSMHRPRTDTGVRLFGINPIPSFPLHAAESP